jgi:hypothetical protein
VGFGHNGGCKRTYPEASADREDDQIAMHDEREDFDEAIELKLAEVIGAIGEIQRLMARKNRLETRNLAHLLNTRNGHLEHYKEINGHLCENCRKHSLGDITPQQLDAMAATTA